MCTCAHCKSNWDGPSGSNVPEVTNYLWPFQSPSPQPLPESPPPSPIVTWSLETARLAPANRSPVSRTSYNLGQSGGFFCVSSVKTRNTLFYIQPLAVPMDNVMPAFGSGWDHPEQRQDVRMDEQATVDCGDHWLGHWGLLHITCGSSGSSGLWGDNWSVASTDYSVQYSTVQYRLLHTTCSWQPCDTQVWSQGIPRVWSYGH